MAFICIKTHPIRSLLSSYPTPKPTRRIHRWYRYIPRLWWCGFGAGGLQLRHLGHILTPCHRIRCITFNALRPCLPTSDHMHTKTSMHPSFHVYETAIRGAAVMVVARFAAVPPHYYLQSSYLVPAVAEFIVLMVLHQPMAASANSKRLHNNQIGGESDFCRGYWGLDRVIDPQSQYSGPVVR